MLEFVLLIVGLGAFCFGGYDLGRIHEKHIQKKKLLSTESQ